MKKIIISIFVAFVLVGCSGNNGETFFVQDKSEKYGLVDSTGETKTKFIYDSYQKVGNKGYIVTDEEEYSYLLHTGKVVIEGGTYKKIEALENMLVAYDKNDKITILDAEGEVLYSQSKTVSINISGLPIIKMKEEYVVLDKDGTVFVTSTEAIEYVDILESKFVLVGYEKEFRITDPSGEEHRSIRLEIAGDFKLMDQEYSKGYLVYDEKTKKVLSIEESGEISFDVTKDLDTVYFDGNQNIIGQKESTLFYISTDGKNITEINSYYRNGKDYIVKNADLIYGPHIFYKDGKSQEISDVQIDPLASFVQQDIFPVYVREKGYQYYGFNGEKTFDKTFRKALPFDEFDRALVSEDGDTYYLIDVNNAKITDSYVHIELIGQGYYAGYTTNGKYEVLDVNGEKGIDSYFMGEKSVVVFEGNTYGIFNKSGKTYVYNMLEYEVVFACEGDIVFHEDGYFVGNEKTYYSMKGEEFYSR